MTNTTTIKKDFLFRFFEKKKNRILFLVFATLSAMVMVAVFLFSNQPANESAALSSGLSDIIAEFIADIINDNPSQKAAIFAFIQTFIRKLAHFMLFSLLGFCLSSAAINIKGKNLFKKLGTATLIGLVYCISDEVHQLFVSERSGEIRDVAIDFCGVLSGVLITLAFYKTICWVSMKRKNKKSLKKH